MEASAASRWTSCARRRRRSAWSPLPRCGPGHERRAGESAGASRWSTPCAPGWAVVNAWSESFGPGGTLGRDSMHEVVLVHRLRDAIRLLNPDVPDLVREEALQAVTKDRSVMDPVRANRKPCSSSTRPSPTSSPRSSRMPSSTRPPRASSPGASAGSTRCSPGPNGCEPSPATSWPTSSGGVHRQGPARRRPAVGVGGGRARPARHRLGRVAGDRWAPERGDLMRTPPRQPLPSRPLA